MNIYTEQLRLKLIETQMALLQYQHKEVLASIKEMQSAQCENNCRESSLLAQRQS